ncbi:MAG: hypothetical protein PHS49_08405 [Candidatus Gracilibacteria bacterium]|nr:hypothetical protein [Candidatus Gracilibacteria bacterium]
MKKIYSDKILNVLNTDLFDNRFLFDVLYDYTNQDVEVIYMSDLLEARKNNEILEKVADKPAMYSNVYSPEDELEIFTELFNQAIKNNKKIHIIGVTLDEEIKILEEYYTSMGFMREDINCFDPDFSQVLVTVSVKIENLMWKGSDYKAMRNKIFFNPPIRESGQVKAMFKGINRGVVAGIYISDFSQDVDNFLSNCVIQENILSMTFAKVLYYNLYGIGFIGTKKELIVNY